MGWFGKQQSILGVDIGTSSIKIVQLKRDNSFLETYGIVDFPGPVTSKTTDQEIAYIVDLLQTLVTKAHAKTKKCAVSLPNSAVFTSVIDLPKMSDKELDAAIQFEAKKYVPLPFSEISLSWTLITENNVDNTMKVLLIAVPKQIRNIYIKIFQDAGLDLEVIEIEALALIRTLVQDPSKNDVIIDIGGKVTGINFIKQGLLHLTRNLNIGGDTITEKIAQTLNLDEQRAEQFKRDFGLNGTEFLPEAVKPVLSTIKKEIQQLVNLYKSHKVDIDRLVLTGGGSQIPGLGAYFTDLGIEVVHSDVMANLGYPDETELALKRYGIQLPVAIGLALRKN